MVLPYHTISHVYVLHAVYTHGPSWSLVSHLHVLEEQGKRGRELQALENRLSKKEAAKQCSESASQSADREEKVRDDPPVLRHGFMHLYNCGNMSLWRRFAPPASATVPPHPFVRQAGALGCRLLMSCNLFFIRLKAFIATRSLFTERKVRKVSFS